MAGYASRFIVIADFRYCSGFSGEGEWLPKPHPHVRGSLWRDVGRVTRSLGFQAVIPADYHSTQHSCMELGLHVWGWGGSSVTLWAELLCLCCYSLGFHREPQEAGQALSTGGDSAHPASSEVRLFHT